MEANKQEFISETYNGFGFKGIAFSNIPAYFPEEKMLNPDEYIGKIKLKLKYVASDVSSFKKDYWKFFSNYILKSKYIGQNIKSHRRMRLDLKTITNKQMDDYTKMITIYEFVKNKMTYNNFQTIFLLNELKKPYEEEIGNLAEINFILLTMLKEAGLDAYSLISTTRKEADFDTFFPSFSHLKYPMVIVKIDNKNHILDASEKKRPANLLPGLCINRTGLVFVKDYLGLLNLKTEAKYKITTFINLKLDKHSNNFIGNVGKIFSGYAALEERKIIDSLVTNDFYKKEIEYKNNGIEVSNLIIENYDNHYKSLKTTYDINLENYIMKIDSLIYIDPMIFFDINIIKFNSNSRKYPIDFLYPIEKIYSLKIQIPENYKIIETPQKNSIKLEDNSASFIFDVNIFNNFISVTSQFKINNIQFKPLQYYELKELYSIVQKTFKQQIILKQK